MSDSIVHNCHYIVPLSGLGSADADRVGAKAANLGELARVGFPVPDGFVLTTDAFERFLAFNSIELDSTPEVLESASLPPDIAAALLDGVVALGDTPLAVRSSGVAEDLPSASFAGQYETVLNVQGFHAVVDAVRRCWSSAFSHRVVHYRVARGQRAGGMAILVQHLVLADAAGVAFTANPVTGNRAETVVSAVRGLGERLVSGQVSPNEWIVCGDDARCQSALEEAIDADQARAVAALARQVEQHFGCPQDVEWALVDGQLFLLQARPITTLSASVQKMIPVPVYVPPGYWQRDFSHAPLPWSPFSRSLLFDARNAGFKHMVTDFGYLFNVELREIGGWEYLCIMFMDSKDQSLMHVRIKECIDAFRSDKAVDFVERWYREWIPNLKARFEELRKVNLLALSDSELIHQLSEVTTLYFDGVDVHFLLQGAFSTIVGDLAFTCRDLLSWDDRETLELVSGLSRKSTEPTHRLANLAQLAQERPPVRRLLESVDKSTFPRLAEVDPDFAGAFADYQDRYGCRCLQYETAAPTIAETPTLILNLLRTQIVRGYDPKLEEAELEKRRRDAVAKARAILREQPIANLERFERVLLRAKQAYPIRDDKDFYTVSGPTALIRYTILELGRRLLDRNQIKERDDVFFLEIEEARAALCDNRSYHTTVELRKAERVWVESHPGPDTYGKYPGLPPWFATLPPEARFVMEAFFWGVDRIVAPDRSQQIQEAETGVLLGIAASPGQYTGQMCVIQSEAEFDKLQPGDVLVCPITMVVPFVKTV